MKEKLDECGRNLTIMSASWYEQVVVGLQSFWSFPPLTHCSKLDVRRLTISLWRAPKDSHTLAIKIATMNVKWLLVNLYKR